MTARWDRITSLFHEALVREPGERAEFLNAECGTDTDLRRQVEAMLVAEACTNDERAMPYVDEDPTESMTLTKVCKRCNVRYEAHRIVCAADGEALVEDPEALVNTTIDGLYQVLRVLGRGGFGVVYLARHSLLRDLVAIKVLPRRLNDESDRVERFLREGRAARALHHPNAVTVYDLRVSGDGTTYMVLEYVEGHTLREEIERRGRIPVAETLSLLEPIAAALDEAHGYGIVHRDLKPENIILGTNSDRQTVKLLDLGIAKLKEVLLSNPSDPVDVTQPGQIIGTPLYMPPEQWGELPSDGNPEIDGRADVYALAFVVFQLLTGRPPFKGTRVNELRRAHLHTPPPSISDTIPSIPAPFEHALLRAMSKDRSDRPPSASAFLAELHAGLDERRAMAETIDAFEKAAPEPVKSTTAPSSKRRAVVVMVAVVASMASLGSATYLGNKLWPRPADRQALAISPVTTMGTCVEAAVSPDGKLVAAVIDDGGRESIQIVQTATHAATPVVPPGEHDLSGPRFSRDGNYVFYLSSLTGGTRDLYRLPAIGGTPQKILSNLDGPPGFSPDGTRMAFIRETTEHRSTLVTANPDGTEEREIAVRAPPLYFAPYAPAWCPTEPIIACASGNREGGFHAGIVGVGVDNGVERELASAVWYYTKDIEWLADGSALVVGAEQGVAGPFQLWVVSYPGGDITKVTTDLNDYVGISLTADSSTLVSVQTRMLSNIWVSASGDGADAGQVTTGASRYYGLAWTPDGRVVYGSLTSGNPDIWIMDANGANARQLTMDASVDREPCVSPDGAYVYYSSNKDGGFNIWRMDLDGGNRVKLTDGSDDRFPFCSADGRWIAYQKYAAGWPTTWMVSTDDGETRQVTTRYSNWPSISPDGRMVASIQSDEVSGAMKGVIVSVEGGPPIRKLDIPFLHVPLFSWQRLRWTPDGRTLMYIDSTGGAGNVWAVDLNARRPPRRLTDFRSDRMFAYEFSRTGAIACVRGTSASDAVSVTNFRTVTLPSGALATSR